MPRNSNCFINIELKAVIRLGINDHAVAVERTACLCIDLWDKTLHQQQQQLCRVTVSTTPGRQTSDSVVINLTCAAAAHCLCLFLLCHQKVALVKKKKKGSRFVYSFSSPFLPPSPFLTGFSFDMLLIWQVKVSFVADTSASRCVAPSAQWCRSHMLLFHMMLLLLLWWL